MILEGSAIVLEEEAVDERKSHEKQFFLAKMQNTPRRVIDDIIAHLKDEFNSERYDYEAILLYRKRYTSSLEWVQAWLLLCKEVFASEKLYSF